MCILFPYPRRFNIGAVYCERCRLMMFKTDIWDKA